MRRQLFSTFTDAVGKLMTRGIAYILPITSDVIHCDSSGVLRAARLSANTRNANVPEWNRSSRWNVVGSSVMRSRATQPTIVQSPTVRRSIASTTNPTTGQFSGLSAAAFHSNHSSPVTESRHAFSGSSGRSGTPVTRYTGWRKKRPEFA